MAIEGLAQLEQELLLPEDSLEKEWDSG